MSGHFVSESCRGEFCVMCRLNSADLGRGVAPATHKVGEEILHDDPNPQRHNLTAYLCCSHFQQLFGAGACRAKPGRGKG
jgi:hypothetical protein